MGNYLLLPEQEGRDSKLLAWFDKWKPFYNDFGDEHKFEDIFGDFKNREGGVIRFKTGVMDKNFYSEKAIEEIKAMFKGELETE